MLIKVKVSAGSKEEKVERIPDSIFSEEGYEGLYYVKLKTPPEQGKANIELLKVLKKYFRKDVKIKSGFTSHMKIIEVGELV